MPLLGPEYPSSRMEMPVVVSLSKITSFIQLAENNRPDHVSPDHDELAYILRDESVVSTNIALTPSDSLLATQNIQGQWEEEKDAAIRIPNCYGDTNVAQIVGYNEPIKSDDFPGRRVVKFFFKWDKELTEDTWQVSNSGINT